MSIATELKHAADNYSAQANKAEADAKKDATRYSWHMGRAGVFRQAAIDFRMMEDLATNDAGREESR